MIRILLSLLLLTGTPAFAEEVAPEPVIEAPAYVPPAEAYEGLGGWAVVDPNTNVVHGVIVCDVQNCGPGGTFNGVLPGEYMGCTNCNLRFQTRATEDGNVAGYSGHSYDIDESGNVTTNNDGSVKWNGSDNTFDITQTTTSNEGTTQVKKKLIPSQTATDGKRLETGMVNIETKFESTKIDNMPAKVEYMQDNIDAQPTSVSVEFEYWRTLRYDSIDQLESNLDADIDFHLESDGYDLTAEEQPIFVQKIKELADKVKRFFGMILS